MTRRGPRPPHRPSAVAVAAALALLALAAGPRPCGAGAALTGLEEAFRRAVRHAAATGVVLVPEGTPPEQAARSSGALVGEEGLVLSDGDAGLVEERVPRKGDPGAPRERRRLDRVEVHVRGPGGSGPRVHAARLLRRDLEADVSLWRIEGDGTFPRLRTGRSGGLEVGDFVFAAGTPLDDPEAVAPAVTAGILAARTPLGGGAAGGRDAFLYVTAAVNPGINGGPLLDVAGRLVGTVSTYVAPGDADEPFQFLGKVVPVDRIRALLADLPEAAALAPEPEGAPAPEAEALSRTFRRAAARAAPYVVSLEVDRAAPLSATGPLGREVLTPRRSGGPCSGVVVSRRGSIVTSLYNLTNVASLVEPLWRPPAGASLEEGLAAVRGVTAHFRDGPSVPARVVATDPRLGVALLRADLAAAGDGAFEPAVFEPAPASAYEAGRFVLALGDPYGADPPPDPLLAFGILSKRHPDDIAAPWRGQWQADVGATDANCGGAVVDLEGRFVGLLAIWSGVEHGRNSGIAFVVPWGRLQRALPDLEAGRSPVRGRLGVRFAPSGEPRLVEVVPGSAAAAAGLETGDLLLRVGRDPVFTATDARTALACRWAGDRVDLDVRRGGRTLRKTAVLAPAEGAGRR